MIMIVIMKWPIKTVWNFIFKWKFFKNTRPRNDPFDNDDDGDDEDNGGDDDDRKTMMMMMIIMTTMIPTTMMMTVMMTTMTTTITMMMMMTMMSTKTMLIIRLAGLWVSTLNQELSPLYTVLSKNLYPTYPEVTLTTAAWPKSQKLLVMLDWPRNCWKSAVKQLVSTGGLDYLTLT